jgi:YesN/AraC family two-component response regulator
VPETPVHTPVRVLVVDDDRAFGASVGEWLSDFGYTVSLAGNGAEALEIVGQVRPAIIVTDIRMPHVDGLELLHRIKALEPTIEVIFLSGQATLHDAVEALRQGRGFDLLQKPLVDLNQLNDSIARALAKRGLQQPTADEAPSLIERALAWIDRHCDQGIGLRDVAEALGYSPAYLTDLSRRETGSTIQQWIIRKRLDAGARLLRETEHPVVTVAHLIGYDDPNYFIRQFRRHYGIPPQSWRETAAAAGSDRQP